MSSSPRLKCRPIGRGKLFCARASAPPRQSPGAQPLYIDKKVSKITRPKTNLNQFTPPKNNIYIYNSCYIILHIHIYSVIGTESMLRANNLGRNYRHVSDARLCSSNLARNRSCAKRNRAHNYRHVSDARLWQRTSLDSL